MKLKGIDFSYAMNAAGARNIFGGGYWYHKLLWPFGLRYRGSTFVAKTITLNENKGHMPLKEDGFTPLELYPPCIRLIPGACSVVNSVGLSNFGLDFYLNKGCWQRRSKPWFLSFMALGETKKDRLQQTAEFTDRLQARLHEFQTPLGLEMNISCPNVDVHFPPELLIEETWEALDIAKSLMIPIVVKMNATVPVAVAKAIADHPACDAICMSSSIPWKQLSAVGLDPERLFGSTTSPVAHIDPKGGGLSGRYLLPIVCDWIKRAREIGFTKPIVGCGGIMHWRDAKRMFDAGADAIQLGSVSLERFWRVQGIIRFANRYGAIKEQERTQNQSIHT